MVIWAVMVLLYLHETIHSLILKNSRYAHFFQRIKYFKKYSKYFKYSNNLSKFINKINFSFFFIKKTI